MVEWWKIQENGSTLIASGKSKQYVQLVIPSLGEQNFGKYFCVAHNWHTDEHVVYLYQSK